MCRLHIPWLEWNSRKDRLLTVVYCMCQCLKCIGSFTNDQSLLSTSQLHCQHLYKVCVARGTDEVSSLAQGARYFTTFGYFIISVTSSIAVIHVDYHHRYRCTRRLQVSCGVGRMQNTPSHRRQSHEFQLTVNQNSSTTFCKLSIGEVGVSNLCTALLLLSLFRVLLPVVTITFFVTTDSVDVFIGELSCVAFRIGFPICSWNLWYQRCVRVCRKDVVK